MLEEAILKPYLQRNHQDIDIPNSSEAGRNPFKQEKSMQQKARALFVSVSTHEQLQAIFTTDNNAQIDGIYLSSDLLFEKNSEKVMQLLQNHAEIDYYLAMPNILRKRSYKYLEQIEESLKNPIWKGVLIRNIETFRWLQEIEYQGEYLADYSVYAWNQETISLYEKLFNRITIPVELNKKETYSLGNLEHCEMLLYGRLPLMYSANCVRKTLVYCENQASAKPEVYKLTDRYQNRFPILQNCLHCYNVLYNTVPMSLHSQLKALMNCNCAVYRIEFSLENEQETKEILNYYLSAINSYENGVDNKKEFPFEQFTNGHYKRGVE